MHRHLPDGVAGEDRAVDAETQEATLGLWDHAAEAGAEAAGLRRLQRQLGSDAVLSAEDADRFEHRRRPAGVDDRRAGVVAGEHRRQQVGDVAVVAGVAVLARHTHLRTEIAAGTAEQLKAAAVLAVAEAEQDAKRHRPFAEAPAQQGQRRDADAAADEDRPGSAGERLARLREAVAERPGNPDLLAWVEAAEAIGSRPDRLDQKVEPDTCGGGAGLGSGDRPRQERPAPAL